MGILPVCVCTLCVCLVPMVCLNLELQTGVSHCMGAGS